MREIIFRGKNKDNNFVYGDLLSNTPDKRCFIQPIDYLVNPTEVHPDTVGQYTGLTDKNGKKIFEGDIVGCFCNTQLFEVKWCDVRGGYFLDDVVFSSCCEPYPECLGNLTDTMEIIGNIWDNPEMIKEVEDESICN